MATVGVEKRRAGAQGDEGVHVGRPVLRATPCAHEELSAGVGEVHRG